MSFGERLTAAMRERGSVCVGIDPHASLLTSWGLPDSAAGVREFSLAVVEELAGTVAALKPQSAFFERHGSAGIAALEETLQACRQAGVISILDVKRGDIGSTMGGYADAYLRPGAPLEADAITVSPFLGAGSLDPAADLAIDHGIELAPVGEARQRVLLRQLAQAIDEGLQLSGVLDRRQARQGRRIDVAAHARRQQRPRHIQTQFVQLEAVGRWGLGHEGS